MVFAPMVSDDCYGLHTFRGDITWRKHRKLGELSKYVEIKKISREMRVIRKSRDETRRYECYRSIVAYRLLVSTLSFLANHASVINRVTVGMSRLIDGAAAVLSASQHLIPSINVIRSDEATKQNGC